MFRFIRISFKSIGGDYNIQSACYTYLKTSKNKPSRSSLKNFFFKVSVGIFSRIWNFHRSRCKWVNKGLPPASWLSPYLCRWSLPVVSLQPGHPVSWDTQPAASSGQVSGRSRCSISVREPAWAARARRPVSRRPCGKASASSWVGMPSVPLLELCLLQLSINGAVFLSGLWEHTPRSGSEPRNRITFLTGWAPAIWHGGGEPVQHPLGSRITDAVC